MTPIRVGIDFDGVIAYNPLRIVRLFITGFKRQILGMRKTKFTIPRSPLQQFIWAIPHKLSWFPSRGVDLLMSLKGNPKYEFYLISGRFAYLTRDLRQWLTKHKLTPVFKSIHTNDANDQPHEFKEKMITKLTLDYFIEDNWDIVDYLTPKTSTKIFWIYNILERNRAYQFRFPYLEAALQAIHETPR